MKILIFISLVLSCFSAPIVIPKYGNHCGCWNETGAWSITTLDPIDKLDWCCQNYYVFWVLGYEEFTSGVLHKCAEEFEPENQNAENEKNVILSLTQINGLLNPENLVNKYLSRVIFYPIFGE